jgi:hypothetical protein
VFHGCRDIRREEKKVRSTQRVDAKALGNQTCLRAGISVQYNFPKVSSTLISSPSPPLKCADACTNFLRTQKNHMVQAAGLAAGKQTKNLFQYANSILDSLWVPPPTLTPLYTVSSSTCTDHIMSATLYLTNSEGCSHSKVLSIAVTETLGDVLSDCAGEGAELFNGLSP